MNDEKEAIKFDSDKIKVELLPTAAVEEIAKVLTFGAQKYDSHNWRHGFEWSRPLGACFRHLFAWARGIDKDPETGLSHLAHAGCNILFLLTFELEGSGEDDRYIDKKEEEPKKPTVEIKYNTLKEAIEAFREPCVRILPISDLIHTIDFGTYRCRSYPGIKFYQEGSDWFELHEDVVTTLEAMYAQST